MHKKEIIDKKTIAASILLIGIFCFVVADKIILQINHFISYAYVYAGDNAYAKGDFQEAIDRYNTALKLYPAHVKARYNLGNIYVAYEDYNGAVICYEKVLKYDPENINARINLAVILSKKLHESDRAIEEYKKAIDSRPFIIKLPFIYDNTHYIKESKAIAYYNLGVAYKTKSMASYSDTESSREYLKKAAECYKKCTKILPDKYEPRYNLALTYHLLKNYQLAHEEYCNAIKYNPLSYETHYNLAVLLMEQKKYKESYSEAENSALLLLLKGNDNMRRLAQGLHSEMYLRDAAMEKLRQNDSKKNNDKTVFEYLKYDKKGKLIISDKKEKLDKIILENMKSCGTGQMYNNVNNSENEY